MNENEKIRQDGELIFWNGILGFIRFQNSDDSIFFHINNLDKNYKTVSLLDKVTFKVGKVKVGKHIGKPMAFDVRFSSKGNFSEHQRTIGILRDWTGRFGFLDSPQTDKTVFLFHSRLINKQNEIQNGEYFTFSPVKSSKNPDQLFAFFAYPLQNEKDIPFLRQQEVDNSILQIKGIISNLIRLQADKPIDVRFELELEELLNQEKQSLYLPLTVLIKQYNEKFGFSPSFQLLKKHIKEPYLIQLWENDVIKSYDLEVMMTYFHNSSADTKRVIINRFPQDEKAKILRNHFELLIRKVKSDKANNDIKTYLGIVYRNKETQEIEIYKEAKRYILDNLTPQENVSLWLNDYIDDLPEKYIVDNFDINNVPSIKKDSEKYTQVVRKIYENYLLSFARDRNFDAEYPKLIQYLLKFKEQFQSDFEAISKASIIQLNRNQKFTLWIFEPSLTFEGHDYFEENWKELNVYFLLKYLIREDVIIDDRIKEKVDSLSEAKIIEFACQFQWNELISPISKEDESPSFLKDVELFINKFERSDIEFNKISETIYDSLPLYTTYHLRLWLYGYVIESRYSYVGYRECFKELSHTEQKLFRVKGDTHIKDEVFEGELLEVEPCQNIIQREGETVTYKAFAENIYFRDGSIILRLENREYTNIHSEPFASSGLNRIPKSSHFNSFEFIVKVEGKDIKAIQGLDDFFTQIQTGEIEKALGKIVEPKSTKDNRNKSYVEDWKLRKQVINYLNEQQFEKYSPKIINEPKSRYRRIDKDTEIETFEKTHLYTIQTADGYGIVWENIDMTEDRATFIFKATSETYQLQIEKIAHSIVSYGQFRSTLVSAREEDNLEIFKNNHGYIAKIHKQRGKNLPFENWRGKLLDALLQPITDLPDFEQIERLRYWQADMPFSPKINKKIGKINVEDLKTVDFDFEKSVAKSKTESNAPKVRIEKKIEILNKLREINQLFKS